ncbi:hypothetical protein FRC00_004397 [Tulasnella sp. 408]|nr:hypothetical protein FRC00_004397 [Tulasnella sp. 408]
MTTAFDAKNPALFDAPVPPQEFGQDGGKFYHYYDTLADEIDDNMVAGLKEQLDGLLIFAGLFAGVNSAFLALTLPLMSPDPADDTNALLRDILFNLASGRNDSLPSTNALPSKTFSPTSKILTVNVLFSVSLTFALVSSFMAVLGRQWLVYYRKRTGGGPERQRWEQLKRFLGAERWRLEGVLDDVLPSLLQIGLIIFCISLTIYLNTLHPLLSRIVGGLMCAGLAILIVTAMFAIWDKFCYVDWPWDAYVANAVKDLLHKYLIAPVTSLPDYVKRKEEGDGTLQITAIRRAICTSDDARTQAHAVSNILSITDANLLVRLANDEEFDARVSELCTSSYNRTLQLCGRDRTDLATATCWVYRAAITHILLSVRDLVQDMRHKRMWHVPWTTSDEPSLFPSSDLTQNASPNMTIACLGFTAWSINRANIQTTARRRALRSTIDGLVNPSWKCISMITEVMMVQWDIHRGAFHQVHAAWIGNPSTVHQNLKSLLEESNDPWCRDRDILREYLVDIFKLASKASADSTADSTRRPVIAADSLRFSQVLVQGNGSPSSLIDAGRQLRVESISVLQSECEKLSGKRKYLSEETVQELCQLFTELMADRSISSATVGRRQTISRNEDDCELVSLFSPVLKQMHANVAAEERNRWGYINEEEDYLTFAQGVKKLETIFASFEVASYRKKD